MSALGLQRSTLHGFIAEMVQPGSTVRTDGLPAYQNLSGCTHDRRIQRRQPDKKPHLLPPAHSRGTLFYRLVAPAPFRSITHPQPVLSFVLSFVLSGE